MRKANATLFSIFSIIAIMLLIAAAWQMLELARNMYLGMMQGKTASLCKENVCNPTTIKKIRAKVAQNLILRNMVADQDADDGNHHQQFDEGESPPGDNSLHSGRSEKSC